MIQMKINSPSHLINQGTKFYMDEHYSINSLTGTRVVMKDINQTNQQILYYARHFLQCQGL